jgi:hypothetical protein
VNISNPQTLEKYAQPVSVSSNSTDINSPLSYKEWYKSYRGIIPSQEFSQYNQYLINWYKNQSNKTTDNNLKIKLNYLTFLKQLQIFLSQEELENWYNNVDINNDKELLLAIPYFARKLKDISLHYLKLRDTVKESKLRYNQIGTNIGITDQVQKFILSEYSKKSNSPITVPAAIWQTLPELSAIKDSITIQIDELYDDHSYFDQSPTLPVSAYFDLNNKELQDFLQSRNLALTSTEWIYKTGTFSLSDDFSDFSEENRQTLNELLVKKYLGRDKYTTTAPSPSSKKDFYAIDITPGNNFFYWPSYVYPTKISELPRYNPVSIQDLNLETIATAGSSIEIADTVFIKTVLGTQGAWLRNNFYEYKKDTLECTIAPSSKTSFRFPYPGFGLSGDDLSWTGFGFKSDVRYQYLNDEFKQEVEKVYWNTDLSLSSVNPISINNSSLIENKAYASKSYSQADKIKVWFIPPGYNQPSFNFIPVEGWLYRFDTTDLSIKAGGNSVIYWPYENLDTTQEFPVYYPEDVSDVCNPLPLSSINFNFSCGSNSLSTSDVIYKLKNYKDPIESAIECCWLSASDYFIPEQNLIMPTQNSLQLHLSAGVYTKFVWTGPDYTNVNDVFKTIKHQSSCKYATTKNVSYLDYDLCDCNQVLFAPFGHPGQKYTDYSSLADFIVEDNSTPEELSLTNEDLFKDTFAWYKTNLNIGWGDGIWYSNNTFVKPGELPDDGIWSDKENWASEDLWTDVDNLNRSGNSFYLRKNKKYIYYRANVVKQDLESVKLPSYVVRHSYPTQNKNVWIKAKKNSEGQWINTSEPSQMILNPGDIISYSRLLSSYYTLSGVVEEITDVLENRGSIWTNADYTTISDIRPIVVSYPVTTLNLNQDPQYPELFFDAIVNVESWTITSPHQISKTFKNSQSFTFLPTLSGIYNISVIALTANANNPSISGYYVFNNIPPVTAVSPITLVPSFTSISTPIPGFVLNTKLNGWDYNSSSSNKYTRIENIGAKPFWAKSYSGKNQYTKYGGIDVVGNYIRLVDDHNLISQPRFSDISFSSGIKVEYDRLYPQKMVWSQPFEMQITVDENQWCTLEFTTSSDSNLSFQLQNIKTSLNVNATTSASNLLFQNIIENEPVEVYYNAINSFTWNITATPEIAETIYPTISETLTIEALQPFANLSNQFYPTVAAFPAFEDLYSVSEVGGYFIPNNLGASQYINKNYNVSYGSFSATLSNNFSNQNGIINGRGLTKEFQETPYIIDSENNEWLKESFITGELAGNINKEVFKTHQKFIPYQSGYDTNSNINLGLITPKSMQSPWTGKEDSEWKDLANYPVSYTGELDIKQWTEDQILKKSGFLLDNWVTDIFGNQYGLYKDLENVPYSERINTPGEIWVRKNSQFVSPGAVALSAVFDTYKGTTIINDLTGSYVLNYITDLSGLNIKKIDLFFDTLMIETPGVLLFEKINYDFEKDEIFSIADDSRYLSLVVPTFTNLLREYAPYPSLVLESSSEFLLKEDEFKILLELKNYGAIAKPGDTWFFPEQKLVTISVCSLSSSSIEDYSSVPSIIAPELYQLDLNKNKFKKVFPLITEDILSIIGLSSLNITEVGRPSLSYNSLNKEYLLTLLCKDENYNDLLIDFNIKDVSPLSLKQITIYNATPPEALTEPSYIKHSLILSAVALETFNFQCSAENGPAIYQAVDFPDWLTLTTNGLITGIVPTEGIYDASFMILNDFGPIHYSLTINTAPAIYYLYTAGYPNNGYITTEPEIPPIEQKIIVIP